MLKTIFSYELVSQYSWKGQKNKKLYTLNIFKVIIGKYKFILFIKRVNFSHL